MQKIDYAELADEALVSLSREGDRLADDELCERYKNTVRVKARPYFLIGGDRDDLIQEGMIGLYKAIRDYSPDHNAVFRSFAEMCIQRQLITAIKGATRKKHAPLNTYISFYGSTFTDDEKERPLLDTMEGVRSESPEEAIISKETAAAIEKSLETLLTELERNVLELFMDGHSYQEIAGRLSCGTKTVDNALQRIKRKLEKNLGEL
ncbi:MAG: RNA polymerase sporulation sigma factor SigH [Clostridiales bacterium]|nr:RNA polymerase sporulation sigma factor SigH [Clostridiales bacterium]